MSVTTVREIVKTKAHQNIWTITPQDSVFDAISLMALHNIGALLVLDSDRIVGLVSERDYARKVILEGRSSKSTKVNDIMSTRVLFIGPDETAEQCMALMTEKRIRHLPVLENDELVGLISMGDIVKAIIDDKSFLIDQLTHYITGSPTNVYEMPRKNLRAVDVKKAYY